jgi:hypothetical protein
LRRSSSGFRAISTSRLELLIQLARCRWTIRKVCSMAPAASHARLALIVRQSVRTTGIQVDPQTVTFASLHRKQRFYKNGGTRPSRSMDSKFGGLIWLNRVGKLVLACFWLSRDTVESITCRFIDGVQRLSFTLTR